MNFLELCQKVARDSGTVSGNLPHTIEGQTGRLGKIIHFVRDAWLEIQLDRDDWQWMEQEFTANLTANVHRYTGPTLQNEDIAEFILPMLTLYDPDLGLGDERKLAVMDRHSFRERYQTGLQTPGRPLHASIDGQGALLLGPSPDNVYTLRGLYRQKPQILAAKDDRPGAPERFHDAIAYRALLLLGEHDEDQVTMQKANRLYRNIRDDMLRTQTQTVSLAGGYLV